MKVRIRIVSGVVSRIRVKGFVSRFVSRIRIRITVPSLDRGAGVRGGLRGFLKRNKP